MGILDAPPARVQTAAFSALKAALQDGTRSCAVQVLGDSTGNDTTDWVYRFAQLMAIGYPAWTVEHRLWSDTTQNYAAPVVIQTGTAGERYLDTATGTATRRLAPSVSPHLSGTIDARFRLSLADWTPATQISLGGRSFGAGTRGWYLLINTAGVPVFAYSVDGTTIATIAANASVGIPDGATRWVRAVFTPDDLAGNRVAKFYTSTDGITWTQVGTTVTTVGAVVLFNPNVGYELGGSGGAINVATSKFYEMQVRDGENGPNVVPVLPDLWPPYTVNSAYFAGAPRLTFVNGSHPGATATYLGDSVRLPKLTPNYGQLVTFLSDSHNEGVSMGAAWISLFDTWRGAVEARMDVPVVILTQNPETSGTPWYREHAARRLDLIAFARKKNIALIDVYRAFLDGGWPGALMADAVHPSTAGSDLWRDTLHRSFNVSE